MSSDETFRRGDRVVYVAAPVFDEIIRPGDTGRVVKVEAGWVSVLWASGVHSVPPAHLRRQAVLPPRQLERVPDDPAWNLVGKRLPALPSGREREPYMEQGSHPDAVERVWDDLGGVLPAACRAQANGAPVLAHPVTNRILAKAHGMRYALRLVVLDYRRALDAGASTTMKWTGGSTTDLRELVGEGWIWGPWDDKHEPGWIVRSYEELGLAQL